MAKRILTLFGILIVARVLIAPDDLSSCGPFLPVTLFSTKRAPLDEPRFFSGRLDILQPKYRSIYLMAAYRYLTGMGLSNEDQQALLAQPAGPDFWMDNGSPAITAWLQTRVQVGAQVGVPPIDRIDRFKFYGPMVYVLNCGDDAFRSASATLVERGSAGASHDDLRTWVAAQDQVFSNCSTPPPWETPPKPASPSIPAALPATAAPWMQAARNYQIACAKFYAGQFDAAEADFRLIANDRSSPWHAIAPYLVARTLIRKATLLDPTAAPAAQEQLRRVLADPDAAAWHASARGLDRYLRTRTEPQQVLAELAHEVVTGKTGVAGAMRDYRLMLARLENGARDGANEPARNEDITDWIAAMQRSPADEVLAKWRAKRSLPWLVAALTYAGDPDPDLMQAAAQVPATSPAFLTVEFHRLRLMPAAEARPELNGILRRNMPVSARNLFLAERMRVARDWEELLRDAPRTAAAITYSENQDESPVKSPSQRYFDDDAARILDRQAPLAVLRLAARNSSLPPNLRLQVAQAVWMRSILLNDTNTATGIAPVWGSLAPYLQPYINGYLSATDDKTRGFAAAWVMLNNPGIRPSIDAGAGRLTPTPKLDPFRDNWWCPAGVEPSSLNAPLELLYQGTSPEAAFLSDAARAQAHREQARLALAPAASTFMARQAVEWAESHPEDSRAPEALHLAVRAGHYACGGDGQAAQWMKRAFRLLHNRYPKTEAARRTPYWY